MLKVIEAEDKMASAVKQLRDSFASQQSQVAITLTIYMMLLYV